ncbi:MAG TPA: alpha/beta hydrolase [Myxococcales bacterium]|nr:alpha/beta hydrolase [Myxococcales bacterium]
MTATQIETGPFQSKDGTSLFYRFIPNESAETTLLFIHGYGEHCGRYESTMRRYHDGGYNVGSFDYRGHGKAEGRRGHVFSFDEYMEDLDAFIQLMLKRLGPSKKLYLVGHSYGGLVVLRYVINQPEGIDGIALSAPFLGFKIKVPAWKALLGKGMSKLWPTLSLPSDVPPEHVSHDPEVIAAYANDPLNHDVATSRWFTEVVQAQHDVLSQARQINLPILVMQGTDDLIVEPECAQTIIDGVASSDKELIWYDGLYHELFNELERESVYSDLDAWLNKH